jgi:nitric oxide dioxygenase
MDNTLGLTTEEQSLIKTTFAKISMRSTTFSELFLNQLFWADQSLLKLSNFPKNEMSRKFMQMMGTVMAVLDKPEELRAIMEELGLEFAAHGVKKRHYTIFGKVLLATLERVLGVNFTPEVKEAWTHLTDFLTTIAVEAAYGKV